MATINNNNTSLEPIAVIGIACEFAGDIHPPNDLWYTLKESQDAGGARTIDRFDLESFIGHMLNINNNEQLHQKLLRDDAESANIDPCHKSLILKFVDLLDGDGYSVEKMSESFLQHSFIGAQSPGGRSRSFSVDANSYAKDDDLALLLLKQLSDAERDGDPIEANYLDRFFNRSNLDPPLLLDLIKSNLGHTEGAAGVLSLIKVAMSIGVNSFETVGSTTHSIIEEYQPINKTSIENGHIDDGNHIKSKQEYFIFIFSNHNDDQAFLQRISQQLLLKRTIRYQHLAIFVFLSRQQLQEQINAFLTEQPSPGLSIISRPTKLLAQKICFVFSGQGPQWWSMGRLLYEKELIEKKNEQESRINDTNIAQPALFAIQVALAALLVSSNIYPSFIISHNAGDQAAAFVAGCLTLEETIRMLAVSMSEENVENKLLKDIEHLACITIVNSPRLSNVRQTVRLYDTITLIIKDEAANVFLEISPHPVLAKSIRECYELTNQQQSPLILPTLKRNENEQITLLTSLVQLTASPQVWQQYFHTRQILPLKDHEEYFDNFPLYKFHLSPCWYEAKDSSIQRLANRIPTHPLLDIRQLNDQTNHKSHDAILFPVVAYLELATAACHQLLSSKKDDQQQPTIIFVDVKFVKVLILNEHELVEVFTQIIMPMREWYIYSRPWSVAGPDCMRSSGMTCTDVVDSFRDQNNLNKYSVNQFTLHAHGKIEIDFKEQKSLTIPPINTIDDTWTTQDITSAYAHLSTRGYQYGSSFQKIKTLRGTSTTVISELSNEHDDNNGCSSFYLLHPSVMDSSFHPFLVILPGIETTFLPVRIQKFIYSSKTKAKMNQSTNIEARGKYHDNICGIGQERTYSLDLWMFSMDNKIEEPIFTFESIVIQEVEDVKSSRW
ncbi:unnamed protein product [Adineta steineri]|uniref:PKS/mFAS DH domain-containing protein n=1 Tax=Adineta steineri TaxID=433720 RepID=A0A813QX80_9BILA|nr:unnamed protein product [Adineta steineri]CAF1375931.1 unnamed protein product [Adineta steineri]